MLLSLLIWSYYFVKFLSQTYIIFSFLDTVLRILSWLPCTSHASHAKHKFLDLLTNCNFADRVTLRPICGKLQTFIKTKSETGNPIVMFFFGISHGS